MIKNSSQNSHDPDVWVITEGIAGTENQCIGVADHLGWKYDVKRITLKQPWKRLSPYIGFETKHIFTPELCEPWPDILITSGRKSVAAARYIKRKSNGMTFSAHIQDPKISYNTFDVIAVPQHDNARGDNIIVTDGSPNKVTEEVLRQARLDFDFGADGSKPVIAVLIGGKSNAYDMSASDTQELARKLAHIDGRLLITCSRRTNEENKAILKKHLDTPKNYFWDGSGTNPYFGFLSWADYILVTADSASMISESCTTGKPVYMIPMEGGARRIESLHNHLISRGSLKVFDGSVGPFQYEPPNDAQIIANEIKKRFQDFTMAAR
jgi:mitochondrial fission protein ELM1